MEVRYRMRGAQGNMGPRSSSWCTAYPSKGRGRVYVADRDNRVIQVFDANGRRVDIWTAIRLAIASVHEAGSSNQRWATARLKAGQVRHDVRVITEGHLRRASGHINNNHSISVDSDGNVYVAYHQIIAVEKFIPKPNTIDRGGLAAGFVRPAGFHTAGCLGIMDRDMLMVAVRPFIVIHS
jgi:hypothetical protein